MDEIVGSIWNLIANAARRAQVRVEIKQRRNGHPVMIIGKPDGNPARVQIKGLDIFYESDGCRKHSDLLEPGSIDRLADQLNRHGVRGVGRANGSCTAPPYIDRARDAYQWARNVRDPYSYKETVCNGWWSAWILFSYKLGLMFSRREVALYSPTSFEKFESVRGPARSRPLSPKIKQLVQEM